MFNTREKQERALGVKLGLKPNRCSSTKCATVRNPARPGPHGKSFRRASSEFGDQLREKQKIRATYGIREAAMRKVFQAALKDPGSTGQFMMVLLERRLDNVVYRLGLGGSRSVARQLVGHGHIMVNGKRTDIPSYRVRVGDVITVRGASKDHAGLRNLGETMKQYEAPVWLAMDKEKMEGKVVQAPKDFDTPFDVNMVVDYYSKIN